MFSLPPALDRLLENNARTVSSPTKFVFLLGCYILLLMALRLALFPGASDDDAEQLFYAQSLAWGYKWNQPPLYTWLVVGVEQIVGVGLLAVSFVKFLSLFCIYLFIWLATRRLTQDGLFAALASLSVLGLYYIGWDAVLNYSHSILAAAFIAATLYLILKLEDGQSLWLYGLIGLVAGLGCLTKYNYPLFLLPFLIASLFHSGLKDALLNRKALLGLVIVIIVVTPHAIWMMTDAGGFAANQSQITYGNPEAGPAKGLLNAGKALLSFLLPTLALALMIFPRAFIPASLPPEARQPAFRVFEIYFLILLVLLAGSVLAFDVEKIRIHWLMPFLPIPVYLALRLKALMPSNKKISAYLGILSLLALIVPLALTGRGLVTPATCTKCNLFIDYARAASQLKQAGFQGGTIVTYDYPAILTGNLRRFFPDSRFISQRFYGFVPEAGPDKRQCLVIWSTNSQYASEYRLAITAYGKATLKLDLAPSLSEQDLTAPVTTLGGLIKGRNENLKYMIVPEEPRGNCF